MSEIVICHRCKGDGKTHGSAMFDDADISYRDGYQLAQQVCPLCNGSGKLRQTITYEAVK